nr:16S rRNA (guanine(527)-N(7))-methyltransferase RsmG [uncultured Agathobaculum sp.]
MTDRELLISGLQALLPSVCPQAVEDLLRFSAMLRETNKVMNLTAVTDPNEIVTRHFLDCAALAPYMQPGARVVDVGTGAGFPGLPLAVLCPQTEFILLDALRKRVDFINEGIASLGLVNCTAVHARAEEFAADNRESFDIAVSRAVADLRVLVELTLPLIRVGGSFYAMKAAGCEAEVQAARHACETLGAPETQLISYTVPHSGVDRMLVFLKKSLPTPAQYPRRFKKIQSTPL